MAVFYDTIKQKQNTLLNNISSHSQNGALHHVELMLKRRMQQIVCLYHHIELPMRHLFMMLDGTTSGELTSC